MAYCHPMKHCRFAAVLVLLLAFSLSSADNISDSLEFLQAFATNFPNALASWTGTDYCANWTGVYCYDDGTFYIRFDSSMTLDASGTLPDAQSADILMTTIMVRYQPLNGNAFTLPDSWSRLKHLGAVEFKHTPRLTGTIPASWASITTLEAVTFWHTGLSGTLPAQWGSLSSLYALLIDDCNIHGTLPAEWSGMTAMSSLRLSTMAVSGTFPKEWVTMTKMLELDLHSTQLSGTISEVFATYSGVIELYLSNTSISGTLPASWSKFQDLYDLELDSMKLEGPLPEEWGQPGALPKLIYFNLTGNDFCGCEPDSWKNVSILHEAVADMPVALATCTNNACPSKSNSAAAPFFSMWTAALILLITIPTSFFL